MFKCQSSLTAGYIRFIRTDVWCQHYTPCWKTYLHLWCPLQAIKHSTQHLQDRIHKTFTNTEITKIKMVLTFISRFFDSCVTALGPFDWDIIWNSELYLCIIYHIPHTYSHRQRFLWQPSLKGKWFSLDSSRFTDKKKNVCVRGRERVLVWLKFLRGTTQMM